ncbi:hypothetical protein [Actinoallomurus rhizosphaericola]|uniref:hypothetical protein n=1 Tax=Actinoallomurus rhizosphaericola TaxID=2952536 RepID=UPI002090B59C|nr:hypothetical protein [Actinoallomurus rhizosphaericola]MCO5994624.1 hypothetical protein [Actinoallomurus rhizosphaericola]
MTTDRHPRLADVFPDLVSDIAQALSAEGPDSFVELFKNSLFYGVCPPHGLPCLMTAPPGSPCPAITEVEVDGEPIAQLYLDVDEASGAVTSITHVLVHDGRDLARCLDHYGLREDGS